MAIVDTIQSMYENVGEVYDTITNVTLPSHKNIENIPSTIRESYLEIMNNGIDVIWDNWEKVVGQGTSLTLSNTVEAPMKIEYGGNTYQDSTTGTNLIGLNIQQYKVALQTGDKITAKNEGTNQLVLNLYTNYGDTTRNDYWTIQSGVTRTITVAHDTEAIKWDTTPQGYAWVNKGETALPYEPYTNGPSPNPDYPQDIHVVTGDNTIEICGRNLGNPNTLFDEMYNSGYANPPTRTIVDNRNVISFSTYYSHNKPLYVTKYKENTQYTFRVVAKAAESALRYLYIIIDYTDGTKSSASIPNQGTSWDELRIVSTANKTIKDFYFSYSNAGYWYIDEDSFNIIEGDTTDYETYQGASYPVNLPVENILDITSSGSSIGGVPFTIENGIIKINGTTSSSSASYYFNTFRAKSESAVFSIEVTGYTDKSSGNSALIIQQSNDGTTEWSTLSELSLNSIYAKQNSVTLDSSKYYRLRWYVDNNTFTNATIKAQLEYGNKKNSFTPYGTTPIELCKIGTYQDRFIRNSGKNLFDKANANILNASMSVVSGGTYMMSQSANAKSLYIPCEPNTTYTMSKVLSARCWMGTSSDTPTTSSTLLNGTYNNGATSLTLTTPSNGHYLVVYYFLNRTDTLSEQTILDSIQIEKGSTATTYEPYGTNEWYLEKKIGKVVLNGTETWGGSSANGYYYALNEMLRTNDYRLSIKSNYYTIGQDYRSGYHEDKQMTGYYVTTQSYPGQNWLYIFDTSYSDKTALATWLSTHNTTVCYVLSTPIYIKITGTYPTLHNQLEEVYRAKSYENETNISQSNNDLPFVLSVSALSQEV